MKILTWNINGIRAAKGKTTIKSLLESLGADIICLQETKVTRDMLDEPTAIVDGYETYFSFSRKRTGYSGTANYCIAKTSPVKAEEGLTGRLSVDSESLVAHYSSTEHLCDADLDALDAEGRCVITQHKIRLAGGQEKEVAIINVYIPLAGDREDRHEYKIKFLGLLQGRAEALLKEGIHVIILGDLNLTHKKLDNCEPEPDENFKLKTSRIWMNSMLQTEEREPLVPQSNDMISELCPSDRKGGFFSDIFRRLHPQRENAFTNWNTATEARKSNFGRRLDYILMDTELAEYATECEIMADFEGSDHCPVVVTLNCEPIASTTTPSLCTKLMPEFRGQQQKLSSFFSKSSKSETPAVFISKVTGCTIPSSPDESFVGPVSNAPLNKSKSLPAAKSDKSKLKRTSSAIEDLRNTKAKKSNTSGKQASLTSFFTASGSALKNSKSSNSSSERITTNSESNGDCRNGKGETSSSQVVNNSSVNIPQKMDEGKLHVVNEISASLTENLDDSPSCPTSDLSLSQNKSDSTLKSSANAWKSLLGGPPPPPLCPGHKEPCVLKTVKKAGPNKNKQFYSCARPDGPPGKTEFRCNFFQWLNERRKKKT